MANFSGVGGTVTIANGSAITATGLTFNTNGYTVTDNAIGGGTGTLTLSGAVNITASIGVTAVVAAVLNDTSTADSLTFTGGGTIQLSGANAGAYLGSAVTIAANTTLQAETSINPFAPSLPQNAGFVVNGILDLNGTSNQSIASLAGTNTAALVTNTSATYANLTIGVNNYIGQTGSTSYAGAITDNPTGPAATQIETPGNPMPGGDLGITISPPGGSGLTLVLTGAANTYHGLTTIGADGLTNPAVLQAGPFVANAFSPNSVVDVRTDGTLDLNGSNQAVAGLASTINGAFTGNGTITNNANSTGNVANGQAAVTLTIGNTALAAGAGSALTSNANIQNGAANTGVLSLTKIGTYTQILAGTNTYSGATNVSAGVLAAGSATGFSAASAYILAAAGTLDVNGFAPTTGSLAGSGTVTNNGGAGGTLVTGSDNTSTTFTGSIVNGANSTALTKLGSGVMTLNTTTDTYSGGTTVQSGILVVAQPTALGTGNVSVTGGALQAGGANRTITVGGSYTQGAGGELDLRIGGTTPGTFDQLNVGGAASLAGKLSVSSINGYAPKNGDTITVITSAGARTGTFGLVAGNLANFPMIKLTPEYFSNSVVLAFSQIPFTAVGPMLNIYLTPNEKAVATALDHLSSNAAATRLVTVLDSLPLQSLPGAYDLIAPEEYGAIYEISRSAAKMEAVTIQNRLDEVHASAEPSGAAGPAGEDYKGSKEVMPPPDKRLSVFTNGSGEFVSVGDSSNAKGYDFASGAATVGIDYRVSEHFLAGVLLNYTGTSADLTSGGRISANAFRGGAYASVFGSGAYVNAFVGGAAADYDVTRAGLGSSVHGSTSGGDFNALIASGYDMHAGGFTYGPVASFQYTYTGLDSFNETGSLVPLHINSGSGESLLTNVGARATYDWHIGSMVLVPEIRATWQHEYGDTFDEISATMLLGSPAFVVTSSPIGRDSLLLNAGFTLRITPDLSAYAFYDGELARSNYQANNVMVGFRASF